MKCHKFDVCALICATVKICVGVCKPVVACICASKMMGCHLERHPYFRISLTGPVSELREGI